MSRALGAVALACAAVTACGARSALPVPDSDSVFVGGDASSCTGVDVPVYPNVPNLYFVLDDSASMLDESKWENVRAAVSVLIDTIQTKARFGVAVFPPPLAQACAAGTEQMALRQGDTDGATAKAFLTATALTPSGGTPTAATFRALTPELRSARGPTYAILATDGGPNCSPTLPPCAVQDCTLNIDFFDQGGTMCPPNGTPNCCGMSGNQCLDGAATVQAIADLRAAGVPTYVMGIPGSLVYGPVLDQMAIAGGTALPGEPRYYAVNSSVASILGEAFTQIANDAMKSCTFYLEGTPDDPSKVNVYLDGTLVPSAGPNGWSQSGTTVTLQGVPCSEIQADGGTQPTVTVRQGCPTVR